MLVTFAITACNEHEELYKLFSDFFTYWPSSDNWEILIQTDEGNTTDEVLEIVNKFSKTYGNLSKIKHISYPLNKDFASFKNNLSKYAKGEWIFQIDADEHLSENLLKGYENLLEAYSDVDLIKLPRINIVKGITQQHIDKWGWNVQQDIPGYENQPVINFPDLQARLYKNQEHIVWKNKVHEIITGHKTEGVITDPDWALIHIKDIDKQEKQNNFYNTLV